MISPCFQITVGIFFAFICVTEADLTASDISTILGAANYFRSKNVQIVGQNGTGAANMLALDWNQELAESARRAAMKCPEEHTVGLPWGENIAFATPSGSFNFVQLFRFWFEKEGASYDLKQNKCLKDQECGHFRQLMWASARTIGCALNRCESMLVLNTYPGDVLVCHFDHAPIHNERPFISGNPCSACPSGYICNQNLCLSPGQNLVIESIQTANNSTAK